MKKTALIAIFGLILAATASARDKADGCGLGWEVTDKMSFTATTTRGTTNYFVPPTFGMTTGTMGCEKLEIGLKDKEAADYVASNFETLKTELAQGQGEYVTGLVKTMGCPANIGELAQANYGASIAPAQDAIELYKNLRNLCSI